jgi:hypothetical protein
MARVAVPAMRISVAADADGRFALGELPVGTHVVQVTLGDGRAQAAGVRVSAERRDRVELRAAAGPGDSLRVWYAPPLATSGSAVGGEALRALPADDVREALRVEAGVVETDDAAGPVVRGGRPGDAPVFVDGVPWRIGSGRAFGYGVPLAAVEEATVWTGPLGPAFGDAQSGLVNLVTRSGGPGFAGHVTAATDEIFGGGASVGLNRFDVSGGGRVGGAVSLFAAASLQGEDAVRRGAGTSDVLAFVPGGVDTVVAETGDPDPLAVTIPEFVQVSGSCDAAANFATGCRGRALPYDWRTAFAGTLRADWRYGTGSGVSITAFADRTQRRFWPGGLAFDPAAYMGARASAFAVVTHWTQRIGGAVGVDVALSRQTADLVSGALDTAWEAGHRDPTMGIELDGMGFLVDFDRFSSDTGAGAVSRLRSAGDWDQLVTNVRTNAGTRVPFLDQFQLRLAQPYRMNPWAAATGFPTEGVDGSITLSEQRYWIARGHATFRPAASSRVRVGGDWQSSDLRWFSGELLRQENMDVFVESPRQVGAFAEYRFATPTVVVEAGVRWERFDPNTIFAVTPGRIFTNPNFDAADPTDPIDSVFAPSEASSVLLPSVRAAWAPLRGTAVRAGVARQARHPDESAVYGRKNADLSFTSTSVVFGREAEWPRSWLIELGVRQAVSAGVTGEAAVWLSTRDRDLTYGPREYYDATRGASTTFFVATNTDTASAKGFDGGLTARAGAWLEARVGYSFQDARETLAVTSNRKHTVTARVGLRAPGTLGQAGWLGTLVRGGETWALFRVASGVPYTRAVNGGLGTISPGLATGIVEPPFASATPAIRELDLRVVKRFTTASVRWGLVFDARNLLGFTNTLRVFTETGEIFNDRHRDRLIAPEVDRLQAEAADRLVTITKNGQSVQAADLRADCGTWAGGPTNCVLLRRAEARWGDGDGLYDDEEQRVAFGALYDLFFGPWTLRGTPRHLRVGIEIGL